MCWELESEITSFVYKAGLQVLKVAFTQDI